MFRRTLHKEAKIRMHPSVILYPVLVQVLLTLIVYVRIGMVKTRAAATGNVDLKKTALHSDAWPDDVLKVSNNLRNQFESPILFYVLCLTLFVTGGVSFFGLLLAWGFVATRIAHVFVHTGSNFVPLRRRIFTIGCMFLLVLLGCAGWAVFSAA